MGISNLHSDTRAVSSVIGIVLMVLIGVVLLASIGSFVFGLHTSVSDSSPEAQFDFKFTDAPSEHDKLVITYTSGRTLAGKNLNVTVSGATNETGTPVRHRANDFPYPKVEVGDTNTIDASDFYSAGISDSGSAGTLDLSEATVRIIWTSPETERTVVLATWNGPDA